MIAEHLRPPNPKSLLPANDVRTKTLIAFSRVSKASYLVAVPLIRAHCVFLDSKLRLTKFVASILHSPPDFVKQGNYSAEMKKGLRGTSNMFLRPFPLSMPPMAPELDLSRFDSFDLPPLSWMETSRLTDSQSRAIVVTMNSALYACSRSLRRLVVDFPLKQIYIPRRSAHVHQEMLTSFRCLGEIEEFIILQDEHYFSVFPLWPTLTPPHHWLAVPSRLRPLLFYNPLCEREAEIWMGMPHVLHQELVIFIGSNQTEAQALEGKRYWLEHADTAGQPHATHDGTPVPSEHDDLPHRNLTLIEYQHTEWRDPHMCLLNWGPFGPSERVRSLSVRRTPVSPRGAKAVTSMPIRRSGRSSRFPRESIWAEAQ